METEKKIRMPHKSLERLAKILKISKPYLSLVLSGKVNISKKKATEFAEKTKETEYGLPMEIWLIKPEKIKEKIASL